MDFTDGEVYQSSFDPKEYLASFCSLGSARDSMLNFRLRKCYEAFGPGGIEGDVLIDIGSGPSIYQLISACESFPYIIASDFTDKNRQEIEKWLKDDPDACDWSEFLKVVCEMEGKGREKWEEKQSKLRSRIQRVLKCDITKSNPLAPADVPLADCVITALCLEAACKNLEEYHSSIRNISSLIKPGGHLVAIGALGDAFYKVGQKTFFSLTLHEDIVRSAVTQAGYTIMDMELFHIPNRATSANITDTYANFFLVAKKEADI